jgi:hypothetical protein
MAPRNDHERLETDVAKRKRFNRHDLLAGAAALAAAGGIGSLALPGAALATNAGPDELAGLWHDVLSAADNSFPPFQTFEIYSGGLWIGSGNTDLSPASLDSSAWGICERVSSRTFRATGRFWTYKPNGTPSGFGVVSYTLTVSKDGNAFHGEGPLHYFDPKGKSLGSPTTLLLNATRITFS